MTMQLVDRIRVERGSVVLWSEFALEGLPVAAVFTGVLLVGWEQAWHPALAWLCGLGIVGMLYLSMRSACLFVARRGSMRWLPSAARPWRWRRGLPDVISVEERPTGACETAIVGSFRREHAYAVRVGDHALVSRTDADAARELARKIALLLGSSLRDATEDPARIWPAAKVADVPRPRPPTSPAPGGPKGRLRELAAPEPTVLLPAGSAPGAHHMPSANGQWTIALFSAAGLAGMLTYSNPKAAVLVLGCSLVVVVLAQGYSVWMRSQATKGEVRVIVEAEAVRIVAGRQPRSWVAPVPRDHIQAVMHEQGVVVLRLAERDVEVAGWELSLEEATWLRAWLAHRLGG